MQNGFNIGLTVSFNSILNLILHCCYIPLSWNFLSTPEKSGNLILPFEWQPCLQFIITWNAEVDDEQIKAIIKLNCHITVQEIAKRLNASHPTIKSHIKCLGFVKKLDICILIAVVRNLLNSVNQYLQ